MRSSRHHWQPSRAGCSRGRWRLLLISASPAVVVAAALGGVGPGSLPHLGGGIANYTMEKRYIRKDGALIWANLTVSLVRKADGSTGYFVSVVDDITARKEAAIELAESRSRLSGVVESAMDAIISIDPRQNVVLFNSAAESMFQCKAADVLGRPLDQLLPQRFAKRHTQQVDAFAQTGVSNRTMGSLGVLRALRAELDHCVKNALATGQAIAMQALNAKMEPAAFVEAFRGRIQALGRAHGLLSRPGWRGADLAMLVDEQLILGLSGADSRISARRPYIMIEPQAALHLGLVLHELGSTARKYGCLSHPEGLDGMVGER